MAADFERYVKVRGGESTPTDPRSVESRGRGAPRVPFDTLVRDPPTETDRPTSWGEVRGSSGDARWA